MSLSPTVAVVIASWNGREHLPPCLEALAAQHDPGVPWKVVVLDNGSTDGTAQWLADCPWPVETLCSRVNLGFAAANNLLVDGVDAEFVVLLNNDTRPEPTWLAALVDALAHAPDDVAAVSGLMVNWDGTRLDAARGVMTFDGHGFQLEAGHPLADVQLPRSGAELPFFCGGNAIVRREAFLAIGGLDESYFAYFEDVDMGWRLWSAGWRVLFSPAAVVRHRGGASSDRLGMFNRGFLFERNAFWTAYKNYDDELWGQLMPAVLLTLMSRAQTLAVSSNPGGALLTREPVSSGSSSFDGSLAARRMGRYRTRLRAMLANGFRRLTGASAPFTHGVDLCDPRTIAQFQSISAILGDLDRASERRRAVQDRRRRPDMEFFARFPAYLVPTYPGDDQLFGSPGFRSWLPPEFPLVEKRLGEVIAC